MATGSGDEYGAGEAMTAGAAAAGGGSGVRFEGRRHGRNPDGLPRRVAQVQLGPVAAGHAEQRIVRQLDRRLGRHDARRLRRRALDQSEEEKRARHLGRLELVEAGEARCFLEGPLAVELLGQAAAVGLQLGQLRHQIGARDEDDLEAVQVAQHEVAVAQPPDRGQHQPLGRQLEVDGALGQHAVLELEVARGVGDDVRQDALDLGPGGVRQLALAHVAGVGQGLGQRVARSHLRGHVLELLGRDLPGLDEDGPELVARIVGRSEEDPAAAEVKGLLVRGTFHLEGAGGSVPVKVHEEEWERLGVDAAADRESVGQRASRALVSTPPPWADRP
jgi:hypothetical protein